LEKVIPYVEKQEKHGKTSFAMAFLFSHKGKTTFSN